MTQPIETPVGICPACGEAVFQSREGEDGPVWTCPSDLNEKNPYFEELPDDYQTTEAEKEANGYYANCPEGLSVVKPGHYVCPIEAYGGYNGNGHMPLHAACYEKGDY